MDVRGVRLCFAGMARKVTLQGRGACKWAVAALITAVSVPAHAQLMMLPGQFDVSPTGAALYTVPIEVPPGTAGMSPALTLDYNSDGGNGLLGVGWSLGGLPSIGRCPKTVAQDGVKDRVDFTADDRFCMDGERLVVVSGTYGAANSEYRTEIEGFTKVVAYGAAGAGPAYFKAWTKSGQIIEFGNTTDSRILATGTSTARSWAANRISDTKGNYLTISYYNNAATGEAYPTRIDFTGNASASLTPYNSVRFEYEDRDDDITQYASGATILTTKRLKRLKTYQGASTVVRVYELAYGTGSSTQRSRVTSIKLCDGSGTNCLPATTFSMTEASLSFPSQPASNPIATGNMGSALALYLGDWNGDGVTDVMTLDAATGANKWFVNNGNLSFTIHTNPIAAAQITGGAIHLGDWNGDGVTDLMWYKSSDGSNRWFTNNGSPSFTQTNNPIATSQFSGGEIHFGDWNGDGISDAMWWDEVTGANRWFVNNGSLTFAQTNNAVTPATIGPFYPINGDPGEYVVGDLTFGDWNGDGLTDFRFFLFYFDKFDPDSPFKDSRWYVNNGGLSFALAPNAVDVVLGAGVHHGDWNGDGVPDIMTWNPTTGANKWYVNDGSVNYALTSNPITTSTVSDSVMVLGDWNADGVDDVMFHWPDTGENRWFLNDGALSFAYVADPITPSQVSGTGALALGDWNGDGFADAMWRLPSSGENKWYYESGQVRPDVLASATTGLGAQTEVAYAPLTASGVYTKESTASYPVIDIQAPFYVVSQVDADNGVGGDYTSTYKYQGAKIDVSGRGFLGFHFQYATDVQTNVVQTLEFRQDYPFIGFVKRDKKHKAGENVTLNEKTNTYAAANLGGTRRFPYLSQMVEESRDLDETPFPTVTSSYAYDSYGNPLTVTVSTPDGATRTTTNTYSNNATTWILGRLTGATVVSSTPDVTPAPTGCQTNCDGDIVSFAIDDVSVTEGSAAVFTVTKTGPEAQAHSVSYATRDGTGLAGTHYTAASGTLDFATGETTKTISVPTIGASVTGPEKLFYVDLSNPTSGAAIAQATGTGAIAAAEPPPSFAIGNASINEGGVLSFTVTKTGATALTHDVDYATADGAGVAGTHYTAKSGTLSFGPAETSKTVTVTTLDDGVHDSDKTVLVNLTNATNGAEIWTAQGTGAIVNIQTAPSISIGNASVNEGGALSFTVTKSGSTALTHAVNYATANGTGVAGTHYTAKSGTVSFSSAETSKTVTVTTINDGVYNVNKTVLVNLTNPTNNATVSDSQGSGTIVNIQAAPAFSIGNASAVAGDPLTFTVTKSGPTALSHSVNYATANGTATAGTHYTATSGTLTFTAGQTSKTVSVATANGSVTYGSPSKSMVVNLSSATSGASIADGQGAGTISGPAENPVCEAKPWLCE